MDNVRNQLTVEVPKQGFVDEGDGVVSFPNGLTITDDTEQRNGTRYDINSLSIDKYGGQVTADHRDELGNIIGESIGTVKLNGKVVVNKIRYAIKENPYARLAYNLLIGGFSKNFSTETIGPRPDDNGVYWNAELVGLSQVVTQNNYNAHINKVVHNSLEQSKKDGFELDEEKVLKQVTRNEVNSDEKESKMEETNKEETKVEETSVESTETKQAPVVEDAKKEGSETPQSAQTAKAEDTAGTQANEEAAETETPTETETQTEDTNNKESEEANNEVEEETKTEEVVPEENKETNNKEEKMDKDENKVAPTLTAEQVAEIVANAVKPLNEKVSSLEAEAKNAFDASAKEAEFKKDESKADEKAENKYAAMDFETRYQAQVEAAWNAVKLDNVESKQILREINQVNLDELKKEGIAKNSITLDDLGNFVIPAEMYNEIQGYRTDYTAILEATEWRETTSLEFAWLQRVGDIDMQPVAIGSSIVDEDGPVDDDERLKPISEYAAVPRKSPLEELAAVTVVATSTTRFAAVDLLADAAAGYRNDYDRKRAQLVIAELEKAVDSTGFSTAYNPSSDVDALTAWLDAVTEVSDTTLNGVLIFNARTFAELKSRALKAGANGPLSEILTTGDLPTVFGYRFVIVPNDLMPSLGGSESISHTVQGDAIAINHAVYFADLQTFTGRTSGGLQYDVSNSASYESGGVVKSAYQRNELVLRGSFFRGGAVKDTSVVAGVRQGAGANVS